MMRLSWDEDGIACITGHETAGAGDLELGGLLLHHSAQEELRAALCPAEARATLEKWADSDSDYRVQVLWPSASCRYYTARLTLDGKSTFEDFDAPTEAEALAAAATHVEGLRNVVVEPEEMTVHAMADELVDLGWRIVIKDRTNGWYPACSDACSVTGVSHAILCGDHETWRGMHVRALHAAREARAAQQ